MHTNSGVWLDFGKSVPMHILYTYIKNITHTHLEREKENEVNIVKRFFINLFLADKVIFISLVPLVCQKVTSESGMDKTHY